MSQQDETLARFAGKLHREVLVLKKENSELKQRLTGLEAAAGAARKENDELRQQLALARSGGNDGEKMNTG